MNDTGEEEIESKWTPRITVSDLNINGMRVHFDPAYPGADSHRICAQFTTNYFSCVKIFQVKIPSVSEFIEIPNNRTYRMLVRPYDNQNQSLYKWMPASSPIFLPPFDIELSTTGIPVESPGPGPGHGENITDSTLIDIPVSTSSNTALIASFSSIAVVAVLLLLVFLFYRYRTRERRDSFKVKRFDEPNIANDIRKSRVPVKITPLYLNDPSRMVEAHLSILETQPDITLERARVDQLHGNIGDWINIQVDSLSRNDNHILLIYVSDKMKDIFMKPDDFYENPEDQVCVRFMKELQNRNITPYVVCFGNQDDLENYPPVTWFPHHSIIPVVKYKTDNSVTFDGTLHLIRQILSIDEASRVSLNSTDTHRLQRLFQNYHSVNMLYEL